MVGWELVWLAWTWRIELLHLLGLAEVDGRYTGVWVLHVALRASL